ncbi:hypothetical protein COO60DRAFT_1267851 [Scenedesmus sp. NREL 46B-D3]|nr:hypothetical protein COO60DRAFT_1267851 [Scenedesmus sp. NREL 46B-D3]
MPLDPAGAAAPAAAKAVPSAKKSVKRFDNGFEIHSTNNGDPHGKLAKSGKKVWVKYVGRLKTGKVFDKTDKKPFQFRLGVGEVIKGWDVGVEGMRVGDKRKLVIPPQMGYGSQRTGPIPPNSVLEFDVSAVHQQQHQHWLHADVPAVRSCAYNGSTSSCVARQESPC